MLEIAFQNQRQHRQLRVGAGPLRLARSSRGALVWQPISGSRAIEGDSVVEISFDADGIALATTGCEIAIGGDDNVAVVDQRRPTLPMRFLIDDTWLEIADGATGRAGHCQPLQRLHAPDGESIATAAPANWRANATGLAPETLAHWFAVLGSLNQRSDCLQALFFQAARSAVESIELDGAMVLRRRDDEWDIAASYLPRPELGILCDPTVLAELVQTPETLYHGATDRSDIEVVDSPCGLAAVVVSPLHDMHGKLAGAIYGYRSVRQGNARRTIRYLEANLIELLAGAVSQGMARLEQEAGAERRRILLEQAIASGGAAQVGRLVSEQREATLLFADLRDFSQLSTELETEQVFELLSQVMDLLTGAVMQYDGHVIDYYGDGLAALWNAPVDQPDHAELACRAALRMLERLPDVAEDWAEWLGTKLRLGVGIHTGNVQVGNAGSSARRKYGPRGANVHIANRVEGATKIVGVPLLITETVVARLSSRLATYRVCRGELTGIHRAFDLYGVVPSALEAATEREVKFYETALQLFEQGRFEQAAFELSKVKPGSILSTDFLNEQIQQELGFLERRRATDKAASLPNGVIRLRVK